MKNEESRLKALCQGLCDSSNGLLRIDDNDEFTSIEGKLAYGMDWSYPSYSKDYDSQSKWVVIAYGSGADRAQRYKKILDQLSCKKKEKPQAVQDQAWTLRCLFEKFIFPYKTISELQLKLEIEGLA